jgi:mono/diheme cytochrome c family protein
MKRVLFLLLTAALALVFLVTIAQDRHRGWVKYQRQFLGTLKGAERRGIARGVHQTIVQGLDRVDRCTTCHLAATKPQLGLAEQPFTAHPGQYLQWHPVEKFGCTVCHGGQGLATEVKAAHGEVPHWEEPLLRGPLVQASCRQCHGEVSTIQEHAPLLVQGQQLFTAKGCYGCHAVHNFGQTVSVDLSEVGAKSHQLIEADFEMMPGPHNRIHWLRRKLAHPRVLNPGVPPEALPRGEEEVFPSSMPFFGLEMADIEALSVYLLSLKAEDLPASYVRPPHTPPEPTYASAVTRGRAVYEHYGCTACHGIGGVGGRRNPNNGLAEEAPSLLYVKAYYGDHVEALKQVIRQGRQPAPRADPHRPNPPLYMPAWKERLSEEDLEALIAYLFALSDRLPAAAVGDLL